MKLNQLFLNIYVARQQEAEYERKLIQVAEMHGELMEFNDYMSRQLKTKETIIGRLKEELVDLRGPVSNAHHYTVV